MLYALVGYDKPNGLSHRMDVRPDHLAHLESLGQKCVLAGPFLDAEGNMNGSFVVVEADSQADAEAFARWRSQQTGHRYRLPTSAEALALDADTGDRPVSLWSRDCGPSCSRRAALGASWRSGQGRRVLPADRGYDDIGFRLLREL